MTITTCDICGKKLDRQNDRIIAGYTWLVAQQTFCLDCGKPVYNFLKKHGFTKKSASA